MSVWLSKVKEFIAQYNRVYFYTADPGATFAVKPFYDAHKGQHKTTEWFVDGWAAHEYISGSQSVEGIDKFLPPDLNKGDAVVMGQQVNFNRAYQRLAHARESGATVIFVSDHWKDISGIFKPDSNSVALLPDTILLPDSEAYNIQLDTLPSKGFTAAQISSCLKVFLHTGVEQSLEKIKSTSQKQKDALFRKYNICSPMTLMLLDCVDRKGKMAIGFDWKDSLESAVKYSQQQKLNTTILVKPHPRQSPQEVKEFISTLKSSTPLKLVEEVQAEPLMSIAEQVWGMTTVLLIVALKAGKPIKAFMPNRTKIGMADSNKHIEPYVIS